MQLEEGAVLNGTLRMGETFLDAPASPEPTVVEPSLLPMSETRETFS